MRRARREALVARVMHGLSPCPSPHPPLAFRTPISPSGPRPGPSFSLPCRQRPPTLKPSLNAATAGACVTSPWAQPTVGQVQCLKHPDLPVSSSACRLHPSRLRPWRLCLPRPPSLTQLATSFAPSSWHCPRPHCCLFHLNSSNTYLFPAAA